MMIVSSYFILGIGYILLPLIASDQKKSSNQRILNGGNQLLNCDFDLNTCEFINVGDYDWLRHSGSTPSTSTGPSNDLSGNGYYMYIESSAPNLPSIGPFILEADLSGYDSGIGIVSFWYSMYGATEGSLQFDISTDLGDNWSTLWSQSGNQGENWLEVTMTVDDPSVTNIRFYGITGSDYLSDIALDDVNITARVTPSPTSSPVPTESPAPTSTPSLAPTPLPTTVSITTESQLNANIGDHVEVVLGGDIDLTDSVYMTYVDDVTISGDGNSINGCGSSRCFLIVGGLVSLQHLKVSDCFSSGYGGGLFIEFGVLKVSRCVFANNDAQLAGGGVYATLGSKLILIDCLFQNNIGFSGGAVRINSDNTTIHIIDSNFTENLASGTNAGAISVIDGGAITMFGGFVYANSVQHDVEEGSGGGLALYGSTGYFDNVEITSNKAFAGGGISIDSSTKLNMTLSKIQGNEAEKGGALYISGATSVIDISYCEIVNNSASVSGGALHLARGLAVINSTIISNNSVIGAVFTTTDGNCESSGGCFFSGNYPSDYDDYESCTFSVGGNGTLAVKSFNVETAYDKLILGGIAYYGRKGPECVEVSNGDLITWSSNSFVTSSGFEICFTAAASGGGLYIVGGTTHVHNSSIMDNHATRNGGGVMVDGAEVMFRETVINNNDASWGSALYIASGSVEATDLSLFGDIEGPSASTITCSSPCRAGEFGNCSLAAGAASCFVNCQCFSCPAGKYSKVVGSTASEFCSDCAAGTVSDVGSSSCTECLVGKYASSDSSEQGGGLTVQVFSGAVSCNDCPTGYYTASRATLVCDACASGKYSMRGASACTDCDTGRYSEGAAGNCTACAVGSFGNDSSLSSCTSCAAGQYQSASGTVSCLKCTPGRAQGATGQVECVDCVAGYFASGEGSVICEACTATTDSLNGAIKCSLSSSNYFVDPLSEVSTKCPPGAVCSGGSSLPIPNKHYYIQRFSPKYVDEVHRCFHETCMGSRRNESCWSLSYLNKSWLVANELEESCNSALIQCSYGSHGALCGACLNDYIYSSTHQQCIRCGKWRDIQVIIVCLGGFMLMLFGIAQSKSKTFNKHWFTGTLKKIDGGVLRVLWSNYQIVHSVSWSIDVTFPSPFNHFLRILSIFSFDSLSIGCLFRKSNYFATVYVYSFIPLIIAAAIMMRYLGVIALNYQRHEESVGVTVESNRKAWIRCSHALLLLTWLVLPVVSLKQLQGLICYKVAGSYYLEVDTSVNCGSAEFASFKIVDVLLVVCYMTIPICWLGLLYSCRDRLNPPTSDPRLARYLRNQDDELKPFRFLFGLYQPRFYYFEVVEIYRRIFIVGSLPLMSTQSKGRAVLGMLMSLVSLALYREMQPFNRKSTNLVAYVAQYAVLITFGSALVLEVNIDRGLNSLALGLLLCLVNSIIIGMVLRLSTIRYFSDRVASRALKLKSSNGKVEWAVGFSPEKLKTTFDSVAEHFVSSSQGLLFSYCSLSSAKRALHEGIPALVQDDHHMDGIILTLHRPYEIDDADRLMFPTFEVSLACAIPLSLLTVLPSSTANGTLFLLHGDVLKALRGSYFGDVVDPTSWYDGCVFLPPSQIIRAHQLEESRNDDEGFEPRVRQLKDMNHQMFVDRKSARTSAAPSVARGSMLNKLWSRDRRSTQSGFRSSSTTVAQTESFSMSSVPSLTSDVVPWSSFLQLPKCCGDFCEAMESLRFHSDMHGWHLVFHFTQPFLAPLIYTSGFRMSTTGQGDGGVYFSTFGPASYQLGSDHYEKNIIVDCFGESRVTEYLNQGKLDLVLVYAMEASVMSPAPGGRSNAVMVSKTAFNALALPHVDGNYFLRPDRILAAFHINCKQWPALTADDLVRLAKEKALETSCRERIMTSMHAQTQMATEIRNQLERHPSAGEVGENEPELGDTLQVQNRDDKANNISTPEIELKTINPISSQDPIKSINHNLRRSSDTKDEDLSRRKSENMLRMSAAFGPTSHKGAVMKRLSSSASDGSVVD